MKPELFNLWKKNLKANKKYFWAVSSCGMLLLSIIFFTMALGDAMSVIATGRESDLLRGYATLSTFVSTYVLLFGLLVINILSYLKKRYFDYEMFTLLGIKKKHKYSFVAMEYGGIILVSVTGGIITGILESEILCYVLEKLLSDSDVNVYYSLTPHVTTIVMGVIMFGVVFVTLDLMVTWFGMAGVLGLGQKGGKKVRFKKVWLELGTFVFIVAVINAATYLGKAMTIVPIILGIFGQLFVMKNITSYWLLKLKKKDHDYYRKLLWLDGWYHQFRHHMNLVFVNTAFFIIIFAYFMIGFMDNIPFSEEEHYPYDLVWLANGEDKEFLAQFETEYRAEIISFPCIRITTPDEAEQTGISESSYRVLTGQELNLKGEEIHIVYQRERSERNRLGIDFGSRSPRMYMGKAREDLWLANTKRASSELSTEYKSTGREDRVLTGVFKDGIKENVIVFSDEFFAKVHPDTDGADLLVMMNFTDRYDEGVEKIRAYARKHSQTDFFAIKEQNLVFEKKEQLMESREEKLMLFTSVCVNLLLLIVCSIFVFTEKMKSDEDEIIAKNRFCFLSGMTEKKRKENVRKEILFSAGQILLWGVSVSVLFAALQIWMKQLNSMEWLLWYVKGTGISILCGVILFLVLATIEVQIITKKAERANENE